MSVSFRAQVISTDREDGTSYMAPNVLIFRYPRDNVTTRSLIIVQPTEMAVVVIQGQVKAVLPPGSHNIKTPQNPLSTILSQLRYDQLPYDTNIYFVSTTRHDVRISGVSQTDDLVPLEYEVAAYYRVAKPELFVTNVQFTNLTFTDSDLATYITPIVDQEVSSILNHVKLTEVFKKFADISTAVTAALKQFLMEIGVDLISVRVTRLVPQDPELRRIIQLRDLGLELHDSVRMGLARIMAEKSDPAAVNMALGVPYYPQLSTIVETGDQLGILTAFAALRRPREQANEQQYKGGEGKQGEQQQ